MIEWLRRWRVRHHLRKSLRHLQLATQVAPGYVQQDWYRLALEAETYIRRMRAEEREW